VALSQIMKYSKMSSAKQVGCYGVVI